MKNDLQYTYAVGRIRALERKLLDRQRFERMIDAKSAEEALKVLGESEYQDAANLADPGDYEVLLSVELKKVYRLLSDLSPEPEVFNLFLWKYDVHNLKVLLKSEFTGQSHEDILIDAGTVTVDDLKTAVAERQFGIFPEVLKKAVLRAIERYNLNHDPQDIDIELDRGMFAQMLETAKESQRGFLVDFVKILVDLYNIKTFLRVKKLKNAWNLVDRVIFQGGSIPVEFFTGCLHEPDVTFADRMKNSPYQSIVEEGILHRSKTGTLTRLEKLSDDHVTEYIKKGKYTAFGIEPLIGYLIAKENEIKMIRMVMVGKINNVPGEILKERMRSFYA